MSSVDALKVVDGLDNTHWWTSTTPNNFNWVYVDLGAPLEVKSGRLIGDAGWTPQTYAIQCSNDHITWNTKFNGTLPNSYDPVIFSI
jgi:hypothetical protein